MEITLTEGIALTGGARPQGVIVEGDVSNWKSVLSGVPLGA